MVRSPIIIFSRAVKMQLLLKIKILCIARIFKAFRLSNVQTLCIFPCFCPYEPKQGKFLFSADYLIQQPCGSTLCFPCSVSVNIHCGTDISVSEKFLHIFRCCIVWCSAFWPSIRNHGWRKGMDDQYCVSETGRTRLCAGIMDIDFSSQIHSETRRRSGISKTFNRYETLMYFSVQMCCTR